LGEGAVVIEEYKGTALAGKSYQPLFDYYKKIDLPNKENIWKVYALPYVEAATGTGLVHLAPAYGAEDLEYTQPLKVPIIHHVGTDGLFKKEVTDFAGMPAKPKDNDQDDTQEGLGHMITDVAIIKNLARRGLLFAKEKIVHSYPHCWRCETPLLNYAATSWFVKVSAIKDQLIAENKKITWVPSEMQEGRFGKILVTICYGDIPIDDIDGIVGNIRQ
jgi:isoleucyl-tRNA synthetase